MEGMNQECNQGAGDTVTKMMKIHMHNRGVHNARETSKEMRRMKIERVVHPPYSPDPSSCNFWFFERAKAALRDRRCANADAMVEALMNLWDSITFEELQSVFQNWLRDWNRSSNTIESALLNDESKRFSFRRGAEIGRGSLLFARPLFFSAIPAAVDFSSGYHLVNLP
jgi:hypothetical protein